MTSSASAIVSVTDLILGRVAPDAGDAVSALDRERSVAEATARLLDAAFGEATPEEGSAYLRKLLDALEVPLPAVLAAAWREYEEFLRFAEAEGRPASSGEVDLVEHEIEARWEIAPRIEGRELAGPRLLVALEVRIGAATVRVRDGRFVGLEAGELEYSGSLGLDGLEDELAAVGPAVVRLPGEGLDFGDGWPIRLI